MILFPGIFPDGCTPSVTQFPVPTDGCMTAVLIIPLLYLAVMAVWRLWLARLLSGGSWVIPSFWVAAHRGSVPPLAWCSEELACRPVIPYNRRWDTIHYGVLSLYTLCTPFCTPSCTPSCTPCTPLHSVHEIDLNIHQVLDTETSTAVPLDWCTTTSITYRSYCRDSICVVDLHTSDRSTYIR